MDDTGQWCNEVRLVGRVSAPAQERALPSGDVLVTWRLVVPRPARAGGGAASVDTIDVACWSGRSRLAARRLAAGDVVEVSGALRRRFYRAGAATASRYEVEAERITRQKVGRADRSGIKKHGATRRG